MSNANHRLANIALTRAPSVDATEAASLTAQAESQGTPLDSGLRQFFAPSFGTRLDQVRVHTNQHADHLARATNADALTSQANVFFRQGAYRPHEPTGQALLAHELVHVVQQQATASPGTQLNRDRSLETEANTQAARALAGAPVAVTGTASGLQRHETGTPLLLTDRPWGDVERQQTRVSEARQAIQSGGWGTTPQPRTNAQVAAATHAGPGRALAELQALLEPNVFEELQLSAQLSFLTTLCQQISPARIADLTRSFGANGLRPLVEQLGAVQINQFLQAHEPQELQTLVVAYSLPQLAQLLPVVNVALLTALAQALNGQMLGQFVQAWSPTEINELLAVVKPANLAPQLAACTPVALKRAFTCVERQYFVQLDADWLSFWQGLQGAMADTAVAQTITRLVGTQAPEQARHRIELIRPFQFNEQLYDYARNKASLEPKAQFQRDVKELDQERPARLKSTTETLTTQKKQERQIAPLEKAPTGSPKNPAYQEKKKQWDLKQKEYDNKIKAIQQEATQEAPALVDAAIATRKTELAQVRETQIEQNFAQQRQDFEAFSAQHQNHPDAPWAFMVAGSDQQLADILLTTCNAHAELKPFAADALSAAGQQASLLPTALTRVQTCLAAGLSAAKVRLLLAYLVRCSDQTTITWLINRGANQSLDVLAQDLEALELPSAAAQLGNVRIILDHLVVRNQFATILKGLRDGAMLTVLATEAQQNRLTKTFIDCLKALAADKLAALHTEVEQLMLNAANQRGKYDTRDKIYAEALGQYPIDTVILAINQAAQHHLDEQFVQYILKNKLSNSDLHTQNNYRFYEYVLERWLNAGNTMSYDHREGYGPQQWTGFFQADVTINGYSHGTIHVHNHFKKIGQGQSSLHISRAMKNNGRELENSSVISKKCRDAYVQHGPIAGVNPRHDYL